MHAMINRAAWAAWATVVLTSGAALAGADERPEVLRELQAQQAFGGRKILSVFLDALDTSPSPAITNVLFSGLVNVGGRDFVRFEPIGGPGLQAIGWTVPLDRIVAISFAPQPASPAAAATRPAE